MQEHELQKIIETIQQTTAESVEKHVNGKIRNLDAKFETYIKEDTAWKETVQPVLDAWNTAGNVGKFLKWSSSIIIATGVIFSIKFFK